MTAGLCLQTASILAQDQVPSKGDTKGDDASPGGGKPASKQVHKGAQKRAVSPGDKAGKTSNSSKEGTLESKNTRTPNSSTTDRITRQTAQQQSSQQQSSRQQSPALVVQGNQSNHYDGRWSSASSHSDWDQQTDHQWRNHDYRWYDGGWLIIDTSSVPGNNSIGSNVQESLTQQGYYSGPIDGDIGRGTRRAISNYQSDKGLQVNGQIDEPLLVSLKLE